MVPIVPNLFYLIVPHFGIGFGIGSIDSALMPLLAELVDEQFAAQYGYVYATAQTAASAAYAFGPFLGGTLLNRQLLSFESLMHLIGLANIALCVISIWMRSTFRSNKWTNRYSFDDTHSDDIANDGADDDDDNGKQNIRMQQLESSMYQKLNHV